MDNLTLIESFSEFKDDKLIDRVTLMAILEEVFRSTLKRKYGDDENFDVIINPDEGDLEIWRNRIVVEDDNVEDDNVEIALSQARKIEPDFEVGEDVSEEVKLVDLGRRSILALRQKQNKISKSLLAFGLIVLTFFQAWWGSMVVATNIVPWVLTVHMVIAALMIAWQILIMSVWNRSTIIVPKSLKLIALSNSIRSWLFFSLTLIQEKYFIVIFKYA